MPIDWLPVPALSQSRPGRCLPACARMILAYLGDDRTEDELARLLKSHPAGTASRNIRRLESWGYQVEYGQTSLARLHEYLTADLPPIIFVQTGSLNYWQENVNHAIVLVALTSEHATVIDPEFDLPQTVPLSHFLLAWSDFDYSFAVIKKILAGVP